MSEPRVQQSGICKCISVNLVLLWSAKLKDFIAWFLMNILWWFKIIWIMGISGVQNHKMWCKENITRSDRTKSWKFGKCYILTRYVFKVRSMLEFKLGKCLIFNIMWFFIGVSPALLKVVGKVAEAREVFIKWLPRPW